MSAETKKVKAAVYIEELLSQRFEIEVELGVDPIQRAIMMYKNGNLILEPGNGAEVIQHQILREYDDGTTTDAYEFWPDDETDYEVDYHALTDEELINNTCPGDSVPATLADHIESLEYRLHLVQEAQDIMKQRAEYFGRAGDLNYASAYRNAASMIEYALAGNYDCLAQFVPERDTNWDDFKKDEVD